MKEKDIAEKQLEAYEDVYADIINVLLFQEETEIDELEIAVTQTTYDASNRLHAMERDLAKYWKRGNIRLAFIGIENQTTIDKNMPLRIIGYDGAAYRAQLLDKKQKIHYPVVTLVLYFGYKKRWNKPLNLKACLDIPKKLLPYVNDYRINVFEIAYLSDEKVALFKSDFRIIADYFVQMRKNNNYVPTDILMKHAYETMKLLSVLTKDKRFVKVCKQEEEMTMCEVLDRIEARGFKRGEKHGEKRGEKRGKKQGRIEMLKELVEDGILSMEEAAKRINMSEESFYKKVYKNVLS